MDKQTESSWMDSRKAKLDEDAFIQAVLDGSLFRGRWTLYFSDGAPPEVSGTADPTVKAFLQRVVSERGLQGADLDRLVEDIGAFNS